MPNNMGHSLEMFQINAASNVQEKDESMNICSCEAKHEHFYSLTNHGATICCVIYNLLTNYFKIYQKVPCQIPWKETFGNGNPAHRWSCLCALSWRNMISYQVALFDTALFKKMNILFEWIFWILKKWIFFLNEYSGF